MSETREGELRNPRTRAGLFLWGEGHDHSYGWWADRIVAVEDEASAPELVRLAEVRAVMDDLIASLEREYAAHSGDPMPYYGNGIGYALAAIRGRALDTLIE